MYSTKWCSTFLLALALQGCGSVPDQKAILTICGDCRIVVISDLGDPDERTPLEQWLEAFGDWP